MTADLRLPHTRIGPIRSVFLSAGGVNRAVLANCPTEVEHATNLGIAVVIPTILAFFGGLVAVALNVSGSLDATSLALALPVAAVIALVVFAVDRMMVTSPLSVASLVVRGVVTLALAWLIGEQLLLAVYRSEVDRELTAIHATETAEAASAIGADTEAELARIDDRLSDLTTPDPELAAARTDLDEAEAGVDGARAALERLQVALTAEIGGVAAAGATGRPGDGPVADALRAEIALAETSLAEATARRDRAAERHDELAATAAVTDAGVADEIADLRARRLDVVAAADAAVASTSAAIAADDGVLVRIEALERLARRTPMMAAQVWALRLLLLAVDTLPMTVKLAGVRRARRPYDDLVDAYQHVEMARAERIRGAVDPSRQARLDGERPTIDLAVEPAGGTEMAAAGPAGPPSGVRGLGSGKLTPIRRRVSTLN